MVPAALKQQTGASKHSPESQVSRESIKLGRWSSKNRRVQAAFSVHLLLLLLLLLQHQPVATLHTSDHQLPPKFGWGRQSFIHGTNELGHCISRRRPTRSAPPRRYGQSITPALPRLGLCFSLAPPAHPSLLTLPWVISVYATLSYSASTRSSPRPRFFTVHGSSAHFTPPCHTFSPPVNVALLSNFFLPHCNIYLSL